MRTAQPTPTEAWTLAPIALAEVADLASLDPDGDPWPLLPDRPIGQLVRPRHDGLCAIEFFVTPVGSTAGGRLRATLERDHPGGPLLGVANVPLTEITSASFLRFAFPPVVGARGGAFFASLHVDQPGIAIAIAHSAGQGAWRDGQPVATSLVFRTFAAAADARAADRQTIEHLLHAQAELTSELIVARHRLHQLNGEQQAMAHHLRAVLARLLPASDQGPDRSSAT